MNKIGFTSKLFEDDRMEPAPAIASPRSDSPVKSVVQIYFPDRNMTLSYFNDSFDLRRGDRVYVDGKLEGYRGTVVNIAYNFKIKISQYQKVVALVDTDVHGEFFMTGSHFATFDSNAIPKKKIRGWFKSPDDNEEYVSGEGDDSSFSLDDLSQMNILYSGISERGQSYYFGNRVKYICLDQGKGYALVEGSDTYEVEFTCSNRQISNLVCDCFCSYNCKHEYAVMLQLREILDNIEKNHAAEYERSGYFAAICKDTLFSFAIEGKEAGSITL